MQRGEIHFVSPDPVVGREQHGRRPAVVVSVDAVNRRPLVVTVVPGTSSPRAQRPFPSNVLVPADESGLPDDTVFLCLQVRALDHSRFPPLPAGRLPPDRMVEIETGLRSVLGL